MTAPTGRQQQLRSFLFVPGNRQRFIDKAFELDLDAILFDLEDGVPPAEKAGARELVRHALSRPPGGPLRAVRVNAADTPWYADDLNAVLVAGIDVICLPKVGEPAPVLALAARLTKFEPVTGLAPGSVGIIATIESARALIAAPQVAACHPRLLALMFGAEDFALDLGLGTSREAEARELSYARSAVVVACAAARIGSIDGVYPVLDDHAGLLADIAQARRLGFTAKSAFHPSQVAEINRIFSPGPDELEYARRVVAAFEEAQARGDGSVAVGGQLVDLPIVARAQRLLALENLTHAPRSLA